MNKFRNPSGNGFGGGANRVGLVSFNPLSNRRKFPSIKLIANIAHKVAVPPQRSGSPLNPKCTGMRAGKVGITRKVHAICSSQMVNKNSFNTDARRFGTNFMWSTNIARACRLANRDLILSSYLHGPT